MARRGSRLIRLSETSGKDLDRWKKKISETLNVKLDKVSNRHADLARMISARRGSVKIKELQDILLGKIK